ncbi:MAG TPA: molybdenum cofactor guanylyltransferase MobA [Rhodocyclaceae bacterium]|nr:molybdenum cofactor guanylyltransferase MobA [Rhodocyclaceae bacterium]
MAQQEITAVILAGGLATRLGGVDKGLQTLGDKPLVAHVLERLRPQVGEILINCNRNADVYAGFDCSLAPDRIAGFPGPLAGLHAALHAASTPLVLTAPCDSPFLPTDLAARLLVALADGEAAVARAGRRQPVFALYRRNVLPRLETFLDTGERKVGLWQAQLDCRIADFSDAEDAFRNLNSPDDWPENC